MTGQTLIAGEKLQVGDLVVRGEDGRYYKVLDDLEETMRDEVRIAWEAFVKAREELNKSIAYWRAQYEAGLIK